ncbi:Phosphatidylinositol/phosphatidylcholine transfer protein SFH9 (Protein SEC FOURTEEN HOMOLOGS 9) (AtSFH9) [Durusdinium trenchii]|uniref:Phosphatidylinositol/phosphatidylcholine transfer protein SFH9 (Protein SEC FOURTEEN HOMOLOGS 9) (AtSFH9) n=1 Tax=Durusdinium trenchii TaxID=1381693 RepID=A0ABP0J0M5_9DINO
MEVDTAQAMATHVIAKVIRLPGPGHEGMEELDDISVPATSPATLTIGGLQPSSMYEFQVCAVNSVGSSSSVCIRVLVPPVPPPVLDDPEGDDPAQMLDDTAAESSERHGYASPAAGKPAPGYLLVGGFEVRQTQLPDPKLLGPSFDVAVAKLQNRYGMAEQAALRLYLGCNLDMQEAVRRYDGILEWRQRHFADDLRQTLHSKINSSEPILPPFQEQVAQLVIVNPCVLVAIDGSPVSIYHVGTAQTKAQVHDDQLQRWSLFTAEYVDIWLTQQSARSGRLAGHVQIYDLHNVSFWQISSGALFEKLKILLGAGQNYMEQVSSIFVIRSGSMFSMAWKFIKGWIAPRTASKIHVSNDIPKDLIQLLGPNSSLLPLLKTPQWTPAMERPAHESARTA